MDAERDKGEARKKLHFEWYSPVSLRILMYGEVDKIKLGKTLFPNWRNILSQNKYYFYCKKNPQGTAVGIIVVHLFIELR